MWITFVATRAPLYRGRNPARHFLSARELVADWSAGAPARARFDKRMSGAADRDQARRHETMVRVGCSPALGTAERLLSLRLLTSSSADLTIYRRKPELRSLKSCVKQ